MIVDLSSKYTSSMYLIPLIIICWISFSKSRPFLYPLLISVFIIGVLEGSLRIYYKKNTILFIIFACFFTHSLLCFLPFVFHVKTNKNFLLQIYSFYLLVGISCLFSYFYFNLWPYVITIPWVIFLYIILCPIIWVLLIH
jgi:hypothetical protein